MNKIDSVNNELYPWWLYINLYLNNSYFMDKKNTSNIKSFQAILKATLNFASFLD